MAAMFKTSPFSSADLGDCNWSTVELAQLDDYTNGLPAWVPESPQAPGIGHNGPPKNDPLAGMTQKQVWHDCVWISSETAETKLVLLCVGRFFGPDGRSSSMSYAQIRSDCSLSERFVKYGAKRARDRWLKIEKGKGKLTPNGPQKSLPRHVPTRAGRGTTSATL